MAPHNKKRYDFRTSSYLNKCPMRTISELQNQLNQPRSPKTQNRLLRGITLLNYAVYGKGINDPEMPKPLRRTLAQLTGLHGWELKAVSGAIYHSGRVYVLWEPEFQVTLAMCPTIEDAFHCQQGELARASLYLVYVVS